MISKVMIILKEYLFIADRGYRFCFSLYGLLVCLRLPFCPFLQWLPVHPIDDAHIYHV